MMRLLGAALVATLVVAPPLRAQAPDSLIASGVRAYRNLEFDAAAGFLTRALTLLGPADTARRTEALTYLGASEVYRQRVDTAHAVFRRAVLLSPAYRIDRLIFPPEVTVVFDAARRTTPAVAAQIGREHRFRTGRGELAMTLVGSTFHDIRVEVQRTDGTVAGAIYAGPIADTLPLVWDGRVEGGLPVRSGRYQLAISSIGDDGNPVRILQFPLEVVASQQDTLPLPSAPDSTLLPERRVGRGGVESLVGGLVVGLGVTVLPASVAPGTSHAGGRFAVGLMAAAAGVVSFLSSRGDQTIAENVAANDSVRAAWRSERDAAATENARRRSTADLIIRVGPPQVIDREGS
jgi:hypothetical protein